MSLPLRPLISQVVHSFKAPLALTIGIELISNLQIIHIILKVIEESNEEKSFILIHFLNYVLSYIGEFTPAGLLKQNDDVLEFAWIIFATYLIMHMLTLIGIIVNSKTIVHNKRDLVSGFISLLYLFHSRVIFFLTHFFFVGLIKLYIDCDLAENTSTFCRGSWFIGNIVLCIVNLSLALIKETILYQITPSKDTYAIKNNLYHQNALLHKTLLILLYFFVQGSNGKEQATTVVNLIFLLISIIILYVKLPFYNLTVLKMSIVFTGTTFGFALLSLLLILGVDREILEIICSALIPLVIRALLSCYHFISDKIMSGNFKSPEKVLHFVIQLQESHFGHLSSSIYNQDYTFDIITSNGILINQKLNVEKISKIENKKEFEEQIYCYIIDKLNNILDKHPNSRVLLFFMAEICLKKLENIPRTIILIKKLESLRLSIPAQNSLYEFNLKLKGLHKSGFLEENTNQDMFSYFKYKELAISLQESIKQEVQQHQELWEELKKDAVNVKRAIDIACKIDDLLTNIERKYEINFRNFTQHFINPLILYGAYLELIKEHIDDAKKLIKQFWSLNRAQTRGHGLDVYCEEIGVVIISIEKANLGAIVDASGSMQSIFQIEKKKLIGQQLTILLPEVIANSLIKTIKNYAKSPTRKLDENFVTYGKTPEGNFFEIEVLLKIYPKVDREVKIMCLFRKISPPKPIVMVNTDGIILECSETLRASLNIKSMDQGRLKFQEISLEFEKVNIAFNQVYNNQPGNEAFLSYQSRIKSTGSKLQNLFSREITKSVDSMNLGKEPRKSKLKKLETSGHNVSIGGISQERNKDLCTEYIEGGKMTLLIPDGLRHGIKKEVNYDVQILPYQLNGEIYKIIILTTNDEERNPSFFLDKKETWLAKSNTTAISDFADFFEEVHERGPQKKPIVQKGTLQVKELYSEIASKKPTYVSDDSLSSENKRKNSIKTPDSNQFIQAGSPFRSIKRGKSRAAENEGSISSTSSRTIASVKALKSIFGRDQSFALSRRTSIVLFLIVTLIISLGIYNYFISREAVDQVQTGVGIVNKASLRLSQAMRGWQFATRFWLRYIGLRTGQIGTLQTSIFQSGNMIIQRNKELTQEISKLKERGLFNEIVQSNINLWELNEDFTTTGAPTDSVTATNILGNKMIYIGNMPESEINNDDIKKQVLYLSNNTCNDYFIVSENLIEATHKMLQVTLDNNISNLQLILGLEIAALIGLCLSLLIASRMVIQLHRRLFRALVRMDELNIADRVYQIQQMKLFLDEDIEARGFGINALEEARKGNPVYHQKEKSKGKKNLFSKKGGFQKRSEKLIFKGLVTSLAKYVIATLLVVQIVTILFAVSLAESLSTFRSSQHVTEQLSVTTKAAYRSSVIISTVYMDMDYRNDTRMKVRNESPVTQIYSTIRQFSNVNNDLLTVFSEEGKGITDPLIAEMFQDTICKYLSPSLQTYCAQATTSTSGGQLGLLAVNSQLIMAEEYYVGRYLENPTYDNAKYLIDPYINVMRPAAETLESSYEFINAYIVSKFEDNMNRFVTRITILHVGILAAIIISTIVVQMVAINRFKFLDMCRGNILKTLSYKILLEDKAIGFYLNRHFISTNNALSKIL